MFLFLSPPRNRNRNRDPDPARTIPPRTRLRSGRGPLVRRTSASPPSPRRPGARRSPTRRPPPRARRVAPRLFSPSSRDPDPDPDSDSAGAARADSSTNAARTFATPSAAFSAVHGHPPASASRAAPRSYAPRSRATTARQYVGSQYPGSILRAATNSRSAVAQSPARRARMPRFRRTFAPFGHVAFADAKRATSDAQSTLRDVVRAQASVRTNRGTNTERRSEGADAAKERRREAAVPAAGFFFFFDDEGASSFFFRSARLRVRRVLVRLARIPVVLTNANSTHAPSAGRYISRSATNVPTTRPGTTWSAGASGASEATATQRAARLARRLAAAPARSLRDASSAAA